MMVDNGLEALVAGMSRCSFSGATKDVKVIICNTYSISNRPTGLCNARSGASII
jgi:hypothetical protein